MKTNKKPTVDMSDMHGLLFAYSMLNDIQFALGKTLKHIAGLELPKEEKDHSDYVNGRYRDFFGIDPGFTNDVLPSLKIIRPTPDAWKSEATL
jgi:hypothetical protein